MNLRSWIYISSFTFQCFLVILFFQIWAQNCQEIQNSSKRKKKENVIFIENSAIFIEKNGISTEKNG